MLQFGCFLYLGLIFESNINMCLPPEPLWAEYFNPRGVRRGPLRFRLALRWLWSGNSYFDQAQWNIGSSMGSVGSKEASPQSALNKIIDTDRHIMIAEKTWKEDFPLQILGCCCCFFSLPSSPTLFNSLKTLCLIKSSLPHPD